MMERCGKVEIQRGDAGAPRAHSLNSTHAQYDLF